MLDEESSIVCEDMGKCELNVAFFRKFNTADEVFDIAISEAEERQYAFSGFYVFKDIAEDRITHIGQS